jgi:hypothetical protein
MRTLKAASRLRRFSSYDPNRTSMLSSGTAIFLVSAASISDLL